MLSWTTVRGPRHSGVVTVTADGDDASDIAFRAEFEPQGPLESLGVVHSRVDKDIQRFAAWAERSGGTSRGNGTGRAPSRALTDAVFPESPGKS